MKMLQKKSVQKKNIKFSKIVNFFKIIFIKMFLFSYTSTKHGEGSRNNLANVVETFGEPVFPLSVFMFFFLSLINS